MKDLIALEDLEYRKFVDSLVWIRDKRGRIIPFQLNHVQALVNEKIKENRRKGIKYNIILKYRRGGITTNEQAKNLFYAMRDEGQHVVTLAHEGEDTEKIFGIARLMYNRMHSAYRRQRSPKQKRELEFKDIESKFYIGTAGSSAFSRGSTLQRFHASEVAFWPGSVEQIENLIASLTEAATHGEGVLESTANGVNNWFYEKWQTVSKGQAHWGCIFLPWFMDPTNRIPLSGKKEEQKIAQTLSMEEIELIKLAAVEYKIAITFEQIKWRRVTKSRLRRLFPQEYPETPETAFLSTGTCWFNLDKLASFLLACLPPIKVKWGETLRIWSAPRPGRQYVMGSDVASGIDDDEHDYCNTTVIDKESGEHVATFKCKQRPTDFTRRSVKLGKWYNWAYWGIERNEFGRAVINEAQRTHNYPNLYKHEHFDRKTKETRKEVGWPTNQKTRGILLDDFAEALEDGEFRTNDKQLLGQCKTFVMKKGKFEAGSGYHDDDVLAASIAWQMVSNRKNLPSVTV